MNDRFKVYEFQQDKLKTFLIFCESILLSYLPPKSEVQREVQGSDDLIYELPKDSPFLTFMPSFRPVPCLCKLMTPVVFSV